MKKKTTSTLAERKEQLMKELKAIIKQEEQQIISQHYPILKKQFEGKFFKTENYFGGDTKKWWVYTMITEIKSSDVYDTGGNGVTAHFNGWSFQTSIFGEVTIDTDIERGYVHSLGKQVTKKEFYAAWDKLISKLNKLP